MVEWLILLKQVKVFNYLVFLNDAHNLKIVKIIVTYFYA